MSRRTQRRIRARLEAERQVQQPAASRSEMSATEFMTAMARVAASQPASVVKAAERNPFEPQKPIFDVPASASIAMDWAPDLGTGDWAGADGFADIGFYALRFQELALLAQRPEYRRMVEVLATEMTRKGVDIHTTGDEGSKADKVKAIKQAFADFNVVNMLKVAATDDGFFGRGHIYVDFGDLSDLELATDLGDGASAASRAKRLQGRLKGFRTVEPMWIYPQAYNSTDPLAPDWYRPQQWLVMGRRVHRSRLLTFVGREVPDILKPAYMFGGVSLSQLAKPYVDNWLRTRQSVADLINAFSVMVLSTPMSALLQGGGEQLIARINTFVQGRDNRGLMVLDKDKEDLKNVSAPLGGLEALQAQTQEHMSAVSGIPLVKLLGITPTGLNASSEGEIRVFYDWIHAQQESLFRPNLKRILNLIQLHLFGEVDAEITFRFEPLWSMSEKEKAEVDKLKADTGQVLIDGGSLAPIEERQRLADDPSSPYHGLDVDDVPDLAAEAGEGLEAGGENGGESLLSRFQATEEEDDATTADRVTGLFDRVQNARGRDAA